MEATREALGLGVDFTKVDRFEEGGGSKHAIRTDVP